MSLPALKIVNGQLQDPAGNRVLLRGVSSQGMAMVYGDQANPGTYVPLTLQQYVQRSVAIDGQGKQWNAKTIRLCFEAFPCVDPTRLYQKAGQPYCAPEMSDAQPWQPNAQVDVGVLRSSNGNVYQSFLQFWAADRGQPWNLPAYAVGDVAVGLNTKHVYRCTSPAMQITGDWASGPSGTDPSVTFVDGHLAHWAYLGEAGTTGTTSPSGTGLFADGLAFWRYVGPVTTQAQKDAAWADWSAKVLDTSIQAAVDAGLYAVVCHFDFGPAHHPLRAQRLHDFWGKLAAGKWANHPQVLFELWNESEDIGAFAGGAGSWAVQKFVIQAACDIIRSAGAGNIIIAPSPFFSAWIGEATASPLTGTNIGYSLHQYRSQFQQFPSNVAQIMQGLASGQAVFWTEFGDDTNPTDPAQTWLSTLRPLVEPSEGAAHPPCALFAWSLSNSWVPDLCTDPALMQPTVYGQAVRQWLFDKKDDSQPGGSAPAPVLRTAAPIVDALASPTSAEPILITGKLAPVEAPPPPPATDPTPAQQAAALILAKAKMHLSDARIDVADAQLVADALGVGH